MAPAVTISVPQGVLSGAVTINVSAAGKPTALTLSIDGVQVASGVKSLAYRWDTTQAANGTHTLHAVATFSNGTSTADIQPTVNNMAPPPTVSVSGTPAVGQTLTATVSADVTSIAWQRCDAQGASCVAIAGATVTTYVVTTADEGHTLRCKVTNGSGLSTTSAATAAVPTTQPGGPAAIAGLGYTLVFSDDFTAYDGSVWQDDPAYFVDSFEGNIVTDFNTASGDVGRIWNSVPDPVDANHVVPVTPGVAGQACGLRTFPGSAGGDAQLTGVSVNVQYARAGWSHASPGARVVGQDTWYSVRVRFRGGGIWKPMPGNFNHVVEWHDDAYFSAKSINSPTLFVTCDFVSSPPAGTVGANPKLSFRLIGGDGTNNTTVTRKVWTQPTNVILDHWYLLVWRFKWDKLASNNGGVGSCEFYVDGADFNGRFNTGVSAASDGDPNASGAVWTNPQPFPTLLYDPTNGNQTSYHNFGMFNYHTRDDTLLSSVVDFDEFYVGPTRASVGG